MFRNPHKIIQFEKYLFKNYPPPHGYWMVVPLVHFILFWDVCNNKTTLKRLFWNKYKSSPLLLPVYFIYVYFIIGYLCVGSTTLNKGLLDFFFSSMLLSIYFSQGRVVRRPITCTRLHTDADDCQNMRIHIREVNIKLSVWFYASGMPIPFQHLLYST